IGNDVTELQQAQKALSTAGSQLERLLAASPVALWSCDTTEEFWPNYFSDNIRQLIGYSPQDYYDDRNLLFNQIHPDDLEHSTGWLAKALSEGHISNELRLKHKDGTWRWFQNEARLERDEDGQPLRIVGILRDITANKEADLALHELQDQHNTLVETTPHAIMYLNEQLAVIYANPAAHQLLHLSQEEWQLPKGSIGKYATDENGFPLSESARPTVRVMNTGKPIINQLYGLSAPNENSFRWLKVNAYPIFQPGETKPYRVFCELDDITELHETREELRAAKTRLEHILDTSPMVLYTVKAGDNTRLTYVSNNAERVSGFTTEEILNTLNLIPSRIHPDDLNRVMATLQRLTEEDNITLEYRFLHKDGNYRWMREMRRLERDSHGQPVQAIGLVGDFTAVKEAEEALSELQEQHQALVESTSQGITYIDADRQMLYANPAALRMYNLTLEEMTEPHPGFEHTLVLLDGTEMPLKERPSYIALITGKPVINVIAGLFDPRDGSTRW
ncbi:MAG: PAS domain-containing protein, partial [bacterium]